MSYSWLYCILHWFKHDTQTSKELVQMDINKMMTNGIFTMNDKHTVRKRTQHNTESCNHGSNLLESLINLSVSVTILLFTVKSKFSLLYNRVLLLCIALLICSNRVKFQLTLPIVCCTALLCLSYPKQWNKSLLCVNCFWLTLLSIIWNIYSIIHIYSMHITQILSSAAKPGTHFLENNKIIGVFTMLKLCVSKERNM